MNISTKHLVMKKTFILALAILPYFAFSQQNSPFSPPIDKRLYEAYEKAYVENVAKDDAFLLQRWTYYLDHAFFIADSPLSKTESSESYPSVIINDLAHINILKLEQQQTLKRDYYSEVIYKIEGTNKYLVYYSGKSFIESLNQYLSEKQKAKN